MILVEIFISFMKIGFTSFGGTSMIPLINSEMLSHGWMTTSEVSDIVAIAEMTPGPLGLNCATFAGINTAGILGAIVANLGVLSPTFTLCLVVAIFFEKFKEGKIMGEIMTGVRPVCIGLIFGVMVSLAQSNYVIEGALHFVPLAIGVLDLVLMRKWKWGIPRVLALSAVLGICFVR